MLKFARFTQPISRTRPTAACSTHTARLASPTIASCRRSSSSEWSCGRAESLAGTCPFAPVLSLQFPRNAFSSVRAASVVTPSFSRPMTLSTWLVRICRITGCIPSGSQISGRLSMRSTPGGMMPMMSCGLPSTCTSVPRIGRPANAPCHSSCDRIASGGPPRPGRSAIASVSPGANRRPCAGWTPSAFRRCTSTAAERTRSGRSPAVMLTSPLHEPAPPPTVPPPVVNAPTWTKDRFISRNSTYSGWESLVAVEPATGKCPARRISCSGRG